MLPSCTNSPKPALSLAPHHVLASLVKGEVLSPEKIRATTGGIVPYPHQPSQTRTIPLAFRRGAGLPLPLHRPSPFLQSLQKDNNPSLSTTSLPPLSKVRCCRPKEFGRLPEGLLPICTNPPKTSPSLENRHHPCLLMNALLVSHPYCHTRLVPTPLPPLSKVRRCRPKKIRATTGGIVTPPTFPKLHYTSRFS